MNQIEKNYKNIKMAKYNMGNFHSLIKISKSRKVDFFKKLLGITFNFENIQHNVVAAA